MIHELLIGTNPKARSILTWNMLIGGPNQSYKVNFKEPLPARGKISKRTFAFCSVNTFPKFLQKSFGKERSSLDPVARLIRVWRGVSNCGSAQHGNCIFLIKTFLEKKANADACRSLIMICKLLKPHDLTKTSAGRKSNAADCMPWILVSKLMIHTLSIPNRVFWLPVANDLAPRVGKTPHSGTLNTPLQ